MFFSFVLGKMRGASPVFFLGCMLLLNMPCFAGEEISRERQAELVKLVRNDCGACHGIKLTGGLGPSLQPDSLQGKAPENLRETILRGRTGTAMPPWEKFLSEAEVTWIVDQLLKGFPDAH